jgi:hypothetical protein
VASEKIGTLTLTPDCEFTLEKLLVLAGSVSSLQPNYHLFRSQCYWYSYTVWELIKSRCPAARQNPETMLKVGTHKLTPWITWHTHDGPEQEKKLVETNINEDRTSLAKRFTHAWASFESDLPTYQHVSYYFIA